MHGSCLIVLLVGIILPPWRARSRRVGIIDSEQVFRTRIKPPRRIVLGPNPDLCFLGPKLLFGAWNEAGVHP